MRKTLGLSIAVVILACSFSTADTLILKDGSRHSGAFVSATSRIISFKEGTTVHRYNRSKIHSNIPRLLGESVANGRFRERYT